MSLTGHLKELRNRILIVIAVLFAGLLICFNYAGPIVNLLTEQGTELGYQFVYLSPQALFMQYIKVALIGAVCLGSPVILYEIWAFIRPGLERKENFVFFFACLLYTSLGFPHRRKCPRSKRRRRPTFLFFQRS